jgi:hypothetical protein
VGFITELLTWLAGGSWSINKTRVLTSCCIPLLEQSVSLNFSNLLFRIAACDTSQIFHSATFGVANYANMKVVQSASFSEVRFTEYSANVNTVCVS